MKNLGCKTVQGLDEQDFAGSAYANMHTARFPGGEIRGQIAVHRSDGDDDEN